MALVAASWLRRAPAFVLGASVLVLGSALVSQYVFGNLPCALCILQRWPYVATILLSALALAVGGGRGPAPGRIQAALLALAGVVFLIGGSIAFYHVGVQQRWWEGTAECTSAALDAAETVEQLAQLLEAAPLVRCDEVDWSLFGISLAGYNLMTSIVLAAASLYAARHIAASRRAA